MGEHRFKVVWDREAENLLRRRGNYTLERIHEEFDRDPTKEAMTVDPNSNLFVTPVANRRYSVVWRMLPDQQMARVSAVVPTRFVPEDIGTLKQRVESIVLQESCGRVTLAP
jgi:hypothetical protein